MPKKWELDHKRCNPTSSHAMWTTSLLLLKDTTVLPDYFENHPNISTIVFLLFLLLTHYCWNFIFVERFKLIINTFVFVVNAKIFPPQLWHLHWESIGGLPIFNGNLPWFYIAAPRQMVLCTARKTGWHFFIVSSFLNGIRFCLSRWQCLLYAQNSHTWLKIWHQMTSD